MLGWAADSTSRPEIPPRRVRSPRRSLPTALLVAWLLLPGPADAARFCMLPARFPFDDDDERRARVEGLLTRALEAASIEVEPSPGVGKLVETVEERSGAFFDPATGRVDAPRKAAYLDDLERSARDELGCTAFVQVGLHQVYAWYDGHHANWDGQRKPINSGARIAGQIILGVLSGVYIQERGWVPALSLSIDVTTLRGDAVAFRLAGVEPLMNFSLSRSKDLLPEDRWLEDEAAVEFAIGSALGPDLADLKTNGRPGEEPLPEGFRWE